MRKRRLAARLSRRALMAGTGLTALGLAAAVRPARAQEVEPVASLTIDLASEPPTLDPALVYDADSWSVVHSIYDALVQYGPDGELEPLLAESLTLVDPQTYEIRLREGIVFHNGEPFDARSVSFSVAHLLDPKTGTQVAGDFGVIESVEEVDSQTVRFHLTRPAPWLPALMAAYLAMLPPDYAADPANEFAANPVGTGPYRFAAWERGSAIELTLEPTYALAAIKGKPVASEVVYRFVPEATTRVADLLGGGAGLIRAVPVDQVEAVRRDGAEVIEQPISGSAWVRIPTDEAPFDDVRVRQALNHAVDVDAIVAALLGGSGQRLPTFFPEGGLGFDPALAPYSFDPERARTLLAEAGYPDGFETRLSYASSEREEPIAAIAGYLAEVGIQAELERVETATFNGQWTDPAAASLRFVTWRPLFDPYSLLSLVVSNTGFLSRHDNPEAQALIDQAATETDPAARAAAYLALGGVLHEAPAAIYLWSLTSLYGATAGGPNWTPRPDDYILPTVRP